MLVFFFFCFNDTATTEIYTLSLHDALPIYWFNKGVVANVLENSIQEIWQSPMYTKFRELHMAGRWNDMKLCSNCMDWQHMRWDHGFEKAINRVLGKED